MTGDLRVATIRRLLYPDTDLKRIAYGAPEAADALGVPLRKVWALLRSGVLPARHTGKQYLLPGGTILDIFRAEHPDTDAPQDINDHRDPSVFELDRLYTRANLAVLFGTSRRVIRGLVEGGRVEEPEAIGSARYATGATVLQFLNGVDEPLRASA